VRRATSCEGEEERRGEETREETVLWLCSYTTGSPLFWQPVRSQSLSFSFFPPSAASAVLNPIARSHELTRIALVYGMRPIALTNSVRCLAHPPLYVVVAVVRC